MKIQRIETKKLIISGLVQGVGFRYATLKIAKHLKIKGIVKNLDNGKVKIIAQGDKLSMQKFIDNIRKSPTPFGKVYHLDIKQLAFHNFNDFKIIR